MPSRRASGPRPTLGAHPNANKAAEGVQKAADTGQEKLEESRLKKKIGDLNQELGSLVFAQRTGNPADDTEAEITRLVGKIQAAEDHMTA